MNVRNSQPSDFVGIMKIYEYARELMKQNGNPTQWGDKFPPEEKVLRDIEVGTGYVIEDEDELMREREKQFVQKAVLYPDQEKLTALLDDSDVIADTLSQEILFKSGFYRPVSQEV